MEPFVKINYTKTQKDKSSIIEVLAKEISNGLLPADSKLPPVRVLSHQLGVSKNTVHSVYEELVARGLVKNIERKGFFVESEFLGIKSSEEYHASKPSLISTPVASRKPIGKHVVNLSNVFIDPDLLPKAKIEECFKSILHNPGLHSFHDTQGYAPLREEIAKRLNLRGIKCKPEHVVITTGSQQALDVVCRASLKKSIATENPAYAIGKILFEMNGMESCSLHIDPFKGVDFTVWEDVIRKKRPSLLYLTSSFQNPTGYSYTTTELMRILELSKEYDFGIIEDDWGSDMLSFSEFRPPLRSLGGDNVLYMNSFTKKLLPSLRIGYLVGNEETIKPLIRAKWVSTLGNPMMVEAALFEFLSRGYFDTHLKSLQSQTDIRYLNCLDCLEEFMPNAVEWTKPGGGPILWLEIPRSVNLETLKEKMLENNIHIDLGKESFFSEPHLHGVKIGFAFLPPEILRNCLRILGEKLKEML